MPCRARVCLGRSVRARSVFRTRAECAFDGVYVALEEQQPEWFAVQTVLRTLAAYGSRRLWEPGAVIGSCELDVDGWRMCSGTGQCPATDITAINGHNGPGWFQQLVARKMLDCNRKVLSCVCMRAAHGWPRLGCHKAGALSR